MLQATLSYSAEHQALQLTFPYDPAKVRLAKTIGGHKWRAGAKAWEYPPTIDAARQIVAKFDPDCGEGYAEWWNRAEEERKVADRAAQLLAGNLEISGDFGFLFRTDPLEHQRKYCDWAAMRSIGGLTYRANFCEQGTGKTKMEIDMLVWELSRKMITGMVLIFCPNSVKRNWVREFNIHAPQELFYPIMCDGTAAQKITLLENAAGIMQRGMAVPAMIVNYEVLSQPSQKPVLDHLMDMAHRGLFGKMICDESSMIKNSRSGRGKHAYLLSRHIPIRVIMTGTPYAKHLTDVFQPMKTLSPEILGTSWPAFARHHCEYGGYQGKEIIGYRNQQELYDKVDRHSFRVLLEECGDMPEEVDVQRYCDLTKRQQTATASLKKQMLAQLEDEEGRTWVLTGTNALTQLLRFNQIASGHLEDKTSSRVSVFSPNPKMKLLLSIIKDEIPEDDKGVIWCCHQLDVEKVAEALKAAGIGCVTYYGKDKKDARDENEDQLNSDPNCRFIVATPDAGGYGLNWQVANWAIFYSYNFKWEAQNQARARIRRLTQKKRMTFIWLVAENPVTRQNTHGVSTGVNQYILDNLAETENMALFMTGDFEKRGGDPEQFFRRALEVV